MSHETTDARKHLVWSLHNVVLDAERLLEAVGKDSSVHVADARGRLADQLAHAKRELALISDVGANEVGNVARQANQAVHEHPWAAAEIAAALGAVVGLLLSEYSGTH